MNKLILLLKLLIFLLVIYLIFIAPYGKAEEGKYYYMTATAYCPCGLCCGKWANGETFTGAKAGRGCIAIDHKVYILRLGQKVYVEGYGYGVCNDIGGSIKGWRIDLCFDTHKEAVEWGVQLVKVYVLEVK